MSEKSDDTAGGRAYRSLAAVLWLLWAAAFLIFYYAAFRQLFPVDLKTWEETNYSLAAVPGYWRMLAAVMSPGGLPAAAEAFSRALRALAGAGAVLAAAQVLGIAVCRLFRCHGEDWRERLLYQTAAGLGTLSYLSLALAAAGLYNPTAIKLLATVIVVGGGLWLFLFPAAFDRPLAEKPPGSLPRAGDAAWKAAALAAVLIALVGALAPEKEDDALWYHLGFPKLWLDRGHLVDVRSEYVSLYPMTWELLFGAGMALGGPVAAKLLHFACLPLTGLIVYQTTLRFFPTASPWLAVALFVTIPTVLWEATTAYNDLALAMHSGLTLYALLRYVEGRHWQWLAHAALNLGMALATKHLAFFVLTLAAGGLALRLWIAERRLWRAIAPGVLLALSGLAVALPWYVRSWMATGNPLFPELFGVFGAPPDRWNAATQQALNGFLSAFGRPRSPLNLLTLPWDMTVHAARYGGTLGPMFLLLLPALALVRRRSSVICLALFVLLYLALWASPLSSFQLRFLIPITPMLAVLAAEACGRLAHTLRADTVGSRARLFWGAMFLLLLLNLPPFTSLHEVDRVQWQGWLRHVIHRIPLAVVVGAESEERYLSRNVRSYSAWRYINSRLPANARVLTFSDGDHLYSERERVWSDATMAWPSTWGAEKGKERQALQALLELGVSHILFNKRRLDAVKPDELAIAQPTFIDARCELEYDDANFVLCKLREGGARPGADTGRFYR